MADTSPAAVLAVFRDVTQDHVRTRTPLSLSLTIPGFGDVFCSEVFRAIRGKRLVCLGNVRGTKVIVKLYFASRGAYRHWKRSASGCRAFLERGIPAPGILFSGYLPAYDLYAMVLEYLEGGTRIDRELLAMNDDRKRSELLDRLVRELARHHEAGIIQNDLHLGNFMLWDGRIYSVDGDQVVRLRKTPGMKRSLGNLVGLLANLPAGRDADLDACIRTYVQERHWIISPAQGSSVKQMAYRARRKSISSYLGKALRSRDPFVAQSKPGMFTVFDKRHIDMSLADILGATGRPVKAQGALGKAGYRERTCGSQQLLQLTSRGFGPLAFKSLFRAVRVWKYALLLNRIGLLTPEPVALVLRKKALCLWQCAVYFRPVDGTGLREFLISQDTSGESRERISVELMDTFARMGGIGLSPGRVMPDHILIAGERMIILNPGDLRRFFICSKVRTARDLSKFISHCGDLRARNSVTGKGPA